MMSRIAKTMKQAVGVIEDAPESNLPTSVELNMDENVEIAASDSDEEMKDAEPAEESHVEKAEAPKKKRAVVVRKKKKTESDSDSDDESYDGEFESERDSDEEENEIDLDELNPDGTRIEHELLNLGPIGEARDDASYLAGFDRAPVRGKPIKGFKAGPHLYAQMSMLGRLRMDIKKRELDDMKNAALQHGERAKKCKLSGPVCDSARLIYAAIIRSMTHDAFIIQRGLARPKEETPVDPKDSFPSTISKETIEAVIEHYE